MKRLLITIAAMSFVFSQAPDPKGNWKLSGLSVDYLHIARETTSFYLTVDYPELAGTSFASSSDCGEEGSESICIHLQDIPAGVMFNRLTNGPFTDTGLGGIGVNLNVNIYDNGFGTVAQGSFYPDIELSESQACVTDLQIFAVDENFTWELGPESTFSNSNVLGMENGLLCEGDDLDTPAVECVDNTDEAWGFGLVTGLFDATPATPVPTKMPPVLPYIALTDGTVLGYSCGAWCAGSTGDGSQGGAQGFGGDIGLCAQTCAGWDYATAAQYGFIDDGDSTNDHAPGYLTNGTGTSSKFNVNAGNSAMCEGGWTAGCNPDVDFKLVWNALDSYETGLGFGDDPDVDEDGDGTDFDRIFGVPYISATELNVDVPGCDITGGAPGTFNYALAGDIVSTLGDAGCDDDDDNTPCCSDLPTYSAQYDCGEQVVGAFISGNCFGTVLDGVEAGCLAQTAAGVVAACAAADGDDDDTTNNGTPASFSTGMCVQQAGSDTAQAACDVYGWQATVVSICEGLDVDTDTCTAAASQAGPIFQAYLDANPDFAGDECDLLADPTFAGGACGTIVGGLITETDCSAWVSTLTDGFLNTTAEAQTGADCPTTAANLAAGYAAGDATATATLDGMAVSVLGQSCTAYGAGFTETCLETNGVPNTVNETELYLLNPAEVPATYGYFVTYNGTVFQSLVGTTFPVGTDENGDFIFGTDPGDGSLVAQTFPQYTVNDSDHDFDPACLADGDDSDCSGRLRLTFEPTCVPEIEARQIVAEFVNLLDICERDGDVDYSCAAYDWNYNFLADTDQDGIDAADCEAFAAATGQSYVVNYGAVLPSCDPEDGLTTNCTDYAATVVWNQAYNMCGDGDPNDLIDLGSNGFCALAIPTGMFNEAAAATCGDDGSACVDAVCAGFYDSQGGVPSFEQSCTVGNDQISVSDVIRIINHIIGNDTTGGQSVNQLGGEAACAADLNADGNINVADVVQLVNNIINSSPARVADASEASVIIKNDRIVIDADGYVGGVDMIVEFTDNFSFELADGFASNYAINGNKAHIILVGDKDGVSEVLTMTSGKIVNIEEALVVNSSDFVTTSINQPSIFSVGAAYPNPFNPSTNISLVLNANADLSVKVYNLTGQLVDVIAEGNYSPSSYNWTWKAENLASGVYFIKTQVGSDVNTQKVMLLK